MTPHIPTDPEENKPAKASWESLQQGALDHYEELATKGHHWSSFVPAAIKAYKDPDAPDPYLLWLDSKIREMDTVINSPNQRWNQIRDSAVAKNNAYKEAREKYLQLSSPLTESENENNFTDGLDEN